MKKISKKECYDRLVCLRCGKPLRVRQGQTIAGNAKYHWECSIALNFVRAHNASRRRSYSGGKPKCIICEKSFDGKSLNKHGMCKRCAELVAKRRKYNDDLKRSIDWDNEPKKQKKMPLTPEETRARARRRGHHRWNTDKTVKYYNNPAARKLDEDTTGRYKADPITREYDTVTAEGIAVHVECRGQVYPYLMARK